MASGEVSSGHARALLSIEDKAFALELAQKVRKQAISVREIENLSKKQRKEPKAPAQPKSSWGNHYYKELELALNQTLSRKVAIRHTGEDRGTLQIDFYSREELAEIADALSSCGQR